MKLILIGALLVTCVAAGPLKWFNLEKADAFQMTQEVLEEVKPKVENILEDAAHLWKDFKGKYGKLYETIEEDAHRLGVFIKNLLVIQTHNKLHDAGQKSYRLGVNEYADMEHSEFVRVMNGFRQNKNLTQTLSLGSTYLSPNNIKELPKSVDWRTKGYVTEVKNQGACGSCWSFSATGSLEGQHFRKSGKMISLSEQNLVDCSGKYGNMGCNGGLMDQAFQYVRDNKGIDTENSYPYLAIQEKVCKYDPSMVGATDTGFVDIPSQEESKLEEALATVGPISVAIDAGHHSFQLYHSGVYNEPECSSTQLDHGVLAVGYGTDEETGADYYFVKNSWGPTWGEKGYVRMTRNKDNQCGIATSASYPLV